MPANTAPEQDLRTNREDFVCVCSNCKLFQLMECIHLPQSMRIRMCAALHSIKLGVKCRNEALKPLWSSLQHVALTHGPQPALSDVKKVCFINMPPCTILSMYCILLSLDNA